MSNSPIDNLTRVGQPSSFSTHTNPHFTTATSQMDFRQALALWGVLMDVQLSSEQILKLNLLFKMYLHETRKVCIEEAKRLYREQHPAHCKIMSQGNDCQCFLCKIEKLYEVKI